MPISFTKEDWAKIQEVFDVAVELPVEEQEAVITALCKGIPGQLEHVRSLLHEERNAPNFLEGDVFAIASGPDPKVLRAPRDRLYRQGKAFGDYTLEEPLGEGGMGIVYLATQKKGSISRKVAIKKWKHW